VRYARSGILLFTVAIGLGSAWGCLDVEPLEAAKADFPDGHTPGPCEICFFSPPESDRPSCEDAVARCAAIDRCNVYMTCVRDHGCWDKGVGEELSRCLVPCYLEAGIQSDLDPAVQPAFDMGNCSILKCPGICLTEPDAAAL
jgi:hypothetical protein